MRRAAILVVFCASSALISACIPAATPATDALGYRSYWTDVYTPKHGLTIQLVDSPNIERTRAPLRAAAAELTAITGVHVGVAPGTTTDATGVDGVIKVSVSWQDNNCVGDQVALAGCTNEARTVYGKHTMVSREKIWISPYWMDAGRLTDTWLRALLYHELGHSFGLDHSDQYLGRNQVMRPGFKVAPTSYQAGDINGLRANTYSDTP